MTVVRTGPANEMNKRQVQRTARAAWNGEDWGALLPYGIRARLDAMSETIETLQQKMEAAVCALDFEEAQRCRDMISLMRGGATAAEAQQANLSGLNRQQPGAMGLGTSQQRMTPPPGWQPPPKPDPMTSGRSVRGRPRKS